MLFNSLLFVWDNYIFQLIDIVFVFFFSFVSFVIQNSLNYLILDSK